MRISDALAGISRLFLDTAPVIYFVERNPLNPHDMIAAVGARHCRAPTRNIHVSAF
jgi:hypothetical protein